MEIIIIYLSLVSTKAITWKEVMRVRKKEVPTAYLQHWPTVTPGGRNSPKQWMNYLTYLTYTDSASAAPCGGAIYWVYVNISSELN